MTIDTNELRRLAQAATHPVTKGRWMRLFSERTVYDRMEDGCRGIPVVSTPYSPPHPFEAACLDFIAAANPAAISELLDRLEAAEKERDALRAKIAEMEQQEPVAWRTYDGEGGYDYRSYEDNENYKLGWDARNPNHIGWVEPLYALPGAQPAPSVPEGWKLVPVEPTKEMLESTWVDNEVMETDGHNGIRAALYRAMLAAAPEAKP